MRSFRLIFSLLLCSGGLFSGVLIGQEYHFELYSSPDLIVETWESGGKVKYYVYDETLNLFEEREVASRISPPDSALNFAHHADFSAKAYRKRSVFPAFFHLNVDSGKAEFAFLNDTLSPNRMRSLLKNNQETGFLFDSLVLPDFGLGWGTSVEIAPAGISGDYHLLVWEPQSGASQHWILKNPNSPEEAELVPATELPGNFDRSGKGDFSFSIAETPDGSVWVLALEENLGLGMVYRKLAGSQIFREFASPLPFPLIPFQEGQTTAKMFLYGENLCVFVGHSGGKNRLFYLFGGEWHESQARIPLN